MILDLINNNKTLRTLVLGILLYGMAVELVLFIIGKRSIYNSTGLWCGIIIAALCALHMAWGIDITINLPEKAAISYTRKYTVFRYLLMCLVLVLIGITDIGSPVTLIFGFLGLKAGAYLHPIITKIGG